MALRVIVLACAICMAFGISIPDRTVYLLKRSTGIGLGNWKLPFGRPSFLNRDDDEGDDGYISSAHLLPDYLTHQEFLKPQLQKAGFSGGRIIAGPFPVPLSKLPKPPSRSGSEEGPLSAPPTLPSTVSSTSPPIPPSTIPVAVPSNIPSVKPSVNPSAIPAALPAPSANPARVPIAPQFNYPQKLPVTSKPTKYTPKTPLKLLQRPLAALAEAAASMRPNPARPAQPVQAVQPVQPVQPVRQVVVPQKNKLIYPIPAPTSSNPQWLAAYHGGPETPLSSLGAIKYSLPANPGLAAADIRLNYGGWTPIYSPATSSIRISKPEPLAPAAESESHPEYEAQSQQDIESEHEQEYDPKVVDIEPDSGDAGLSHLKYGDVSAELTTAVNMTADARETLTQEGDNSGSTVTATPKRTVRKLRQLGKQVKRIDTVDYYSRQPNEEVPLPLLNWAPYPTDLEGRGQGRLVGRVLPDYAVFSYDQPAEPSGWRRVGGPSSSPTGYVLHLSH